MTSRLRSFVLSLFVDVLLESNLCPRSTFARSSRSSDDMEAVVSRYWRTCTKARIIEMLAAIAIGLFSTLASMATPCPVKAKGGEDIFLFDDITDCDIIFWTSSSVSRNMKSVGNRSMFLLTAWFNAPEILDDNQIFTHNSTFYRSIQIYAMEEFLSSQEN